MIYHLGKYMIYENEIVTFQKIRMRVLMSMIYSSEGRRKEKTKKKKEIKLFININKNSSLKLM